MIWFFKYRTSGMNPRWEQSTGMSLIEVSFRSWKHKSMTETRIFVNTLNKSPNWWRKIFNLLNLLKCSRKTTTMFLKITRRPTNGNLMSINMYLQCCYSLIKGACQSAYCLLCQICAWGSCINEIMYPYGILVQISCGDRYYSSVWCSIHDPFTFLFHLLFILI